jgi:hypothetical protein
LNSPRESALPGSGRTDQTAELLDTVPPNHSRFDDQSIISRVFSQATWTNLYPCYRLKISVEKREETGTGWFYNHDKAQPRHLSAPRQKPRRIQLRLRSRRFKPFNRFNPFKSLKAFLRAQNINPNVLAQKLSKTSKPPSNNSANRQGSCCRRAYREKTIDER